MLELIAELICSIVGSHLLSKDVLIVLTFTPEFIAHSLYAGHAGSIIITSSPALSNVEIERKTPNLAPGTTKIFSEFTSQSKFSLQNFATVCLNSGSPFAGPYFPNPFSYICDNDFLTDSGGLKSGSPTSR